MRRSVDLFLNSSEAKLSVSGALYSMNEDTAIRDKRGIDSHEVGKR